MSNMVTIQNPKIGVTEQGDAGYDLSWARKIYTRKVDAAILITKCLSRGMGRELLSLQEQGYENIIVHCGCTGRGGTVIEPGAPKYKVQLQSLRKLIDAGFPIERCVLRIDPIIPDSDGLNAAWRVLTAAQELFDMQKLRVRISVVDDYPHVKVRFRAAGLPEIYPGTQFQANAEQFSQVRKLCGMFPGILFETCAEKQLSGPNIVARGCVSDEDLARCGIERLGDQGTNPQNRSGCLCLRGKVELLNHRGQCKNGCLYCYWKPLRPESEPSAAM